MARKDFKINGKRQSFLSSPISVVAVYVSVFVVLSLNIIFLDSSVVGFISSVIYVYLSSLLLGNALFGSETFWHRTLFGFFLFILLVAIGGSAALAIYLLTEKIIILLLFAITSLSIGLTVKAYGFNVFFFGKPILKTDEPVNGNIQKGPFVFTKEHLLQIFYIFLVVTCFVLLFMSRSDEIRVFWEAVQPAFIPLYFAATFVLLTILFSKVRKGIKLLFIIVHSFLIHNLLVIVMNRGLGGDFWYELALARDVYDVGKNVPNLLDFVFGGISYSPFRVIYFVLRKRTLQAFTNIFANMFAVDVYWIQLFLVPILWTIIVPFLMYKIVKMLSGKEECAIFGAFLTFLVPAFIWWGAITVSDTLGKVFFLLVTYFAFKYVASHDRNLNALFFGFLAASVAITTHFLNGIMSFVIILLAIAYRIYESDRKSEGTKRASAPLLVIVGASSMFLPITLLALKDVYPYAGYIHAHFSVEKLLETDILALIFGRYVNYSLSDLFVYLLFPILGVFGLIYIIVFAPKQKNRRSLALFSLLLEVVFLVDYRITKYAMENVLFSPERIWIFRDLMILPFAAVFIFYVASKLYGRVRAYPRVQKRLSFSRLAIVTLILYLAFSGFAVFVAWSAYTPKPILQPTTFEVEAIKYIHENTPEKYVVISDNIIVKLAYGILGSENGRNFTRTHFYTMLDQPSVSTLTSTMAQHGASVGYFVISARYKKDFSRVVSSAMEVLEVYAVFGDGNLYIFHYPPVQEERTVPLMVDSGGVVRENYVVEYELNITKMLFGVPSGHLDPNSIRVKTSEGSELPTQFDGFQGFFDDASSVNTWSAGVSDGDVLIYSVNLTELPEAHRLGYAGNITVDVERYRFMEVKWSENPLDVAFVRFGFWTWNGNHTELLLKWGDPPSREWSTSSFDLSKLNGTLTRLDVFLFDAKPGNWTGNYRLYIDWLRFVSDVGTVRWLYNSTIHSVEQYDIVYDFLENTESGIRDVFPKEYNILPDNNQTTPPPKVESMLLVPLVIRSIDLVGQPVDNVAIEIKELNTSVTTNANGWATFHVPKGSWTLTISENGNIRERTVEVLSNFVTLEKINSIKLNSVIMNIWIYGLLVTLIILTCIVPLFFLHKKMLKHTSLNSG